MISQRFNSKDGPGGHTDTTTSVAFSFTVSGSEDNQSGCGLI